jgi:hypothetical protein
MTAVYVPDNKSMAALLLSKQTRDPAVRAAREIMAIAIAISPYDDREDTDGHYVEHFGVNEHTAPVVVGGNPRVGAEVYNDSGHAAAVEFGNSRNGGRGQRILRRAGSKVGEMRGVPG